MDSGLVGVLIGGVLALLGGVVSPLVQHRLGMSEKREQLERESKTALIRAIHDHRAWADRNRENRMWDKGHYLPVDPIAEIEAIIMTVFPGCISAFRTFATAANTEYHWAAERMGERVQGKQLDLSGWQEIIREYSLASSNLISAVCGQTQMTYEKSFGSSRPPRN
ncbi:MAG: hypothetical protein A3J40_13095 [Erythrobacter sp. RIFCSPHIGHO2_12_FULL_63_10]|nr:MAG: hypothetical protein A3J40_13095 [Erythrobacter sp. RIFCSPHIGHO2_12_FULL_63_10]